MSTFFQPDSNNNGPDFQFTSLEQSDRTQIVNLSSDFVAQQGYAHYLDVNSLELTALGASADLNGEWSPPLGAPLDLVSWRHIAVGGRDLYVRIVKRGWLFPLGHEAVIIKIVERVVLPDPVDKNLYAQAYLGEKTYVRITEPIKSYPAVGQPFGTNDWPFSRVKILTTISPELDPLLIELTTLTPKPVNSPGPGQAIVLTSSGSPVLWATVTTDLAGNELHLQFPSVFVFGDDGVTYVSEFDDQYTAPWVTSYEALDPQYRTVQGNGQHLRFAPEAGGPSTATTHPVLSFLLGASHPSGDPNAPKGAIPPNQPSPDLLVEFTQPAFYPTIASASVRLKAADALTAQTGGFGGTGGVSIQYFPPFVVSGLPEGDPPTVPNNGVYAQMTKAASSATTAAGPLMQFPSNLVGGIGTPNTAMAGLSALKGPIGGALSDLQNYATTGAMDAASYFKNLLTSGNVLPKLFGSLNLIDILGQFTDGLLPTFTSVTDPTTGAATINYQLTADTQPWSPPGLGHVFIPNNNSGTFTLTATIVLSASSPPTYTVQGSITPFTIYLVSDSELAFIEIPFNGFTFTAKSGSKTKVDPSIGSVAFTGALSFVNDLEQFLQDLGGSGLSIAITPTEVDANFSVSLPPVEIGVLTLSGIGFSAGVKVPFLGDPALVTFGFATQDNPFTLTVCMFGGGGFLALGVGFGGVQTVQASFEFAGQFAINIGIASGGISLTAGIYYSYAAAGPTAGTTLTGFVRLSGGLTVLIFSVSMELDLSLTYTTGPSGHSVTGTAELKLSVGVAFFSISIDVSVTKTFSGGGASSASAMGAAAIHTEALPMGGAPMTAVQFAQVVPNLGDWQSYCGAFAA